MLPAHSGYVLCASSLSRCCSNEAQRADTERQRALSAATRLCLMLTLLPVYAVVADAAAVHDYARDVERRGWLKIFIRYAHMRH